MTIEQEIRAAALQAVSTIQAGLFASSRSGEWPLEPDEFTALLERYYDYIQSGTTPPVQ